MANDPNLAALLTALARQDLAEESRGRRFRRAWLVLAAAGGLTVFAGWLLAVAVVPLSLRDRADFAAEAAMWAMRAGLVWSVACLMFGWLFVRLQHWFVGPGFPYVRPGYAVLAIVPLAGAWIIGPVLGFTPGWPSAALLLAIEAPPLATILIFGALMSRFGLWGDARC